MDAWSSNSANVQVIGQTPNNQLLCYGNASSVCSTSANFDTTTAPVLIAAQASAGTVSIWVNGSSKAMGTASPLAAANINSIGKLTGGAIYCSQRIYEQMFFLSLPNATQISQLFEYFRSKYNLY